MIEHLVVLSQPGEVVEAEQIPVDQYTELLTDRPVASSIPMNEGYHVAKDQVLASFEKEYVTHLVSRASGNMSRAARLASVDRTTLYRLLERHGFRRNASEAGAL